MIRSRTLLLALAMLVDISLIVVTVFGAWLMRKAPPGRQYLLAGAVLGAFLLLMLLVMLKASR